jgi:glucose dehydrogenase
MVLGLLWGQLALILGASVGLFGPKNIVFIGKAVGYIQTVQGQFDPILQHSEINTVCDNFFLPFHVCFQVHSSHLGMSSCLASCGLEWEDENGQAMAKHVYKGAPRHNGAAGGYFS